MTVVPGDTASSLNRTLLKQHKQVRSSQAGVLWPRLSQQHPLTVHQLLKATLLQQHKQRYSRAGAFLGNNATTACDTVMVNIHYARGDLVCSRLAWAPGCSNRAVWMRGSLLLALYSWQRSDKLHLRLSNFLVRRSTSGMPAYTTLLFVATKVVAVPDCVMTMRLNAAHLPCLHR